MSIKEQEQHSTQHSANPAEAGRSYVGAVVLLFLLVGVASVVSVMVGVADITWQDLLALKPEALELLSVSRIPRTVALILAGVGMSVSGVVMQQITQNKFVSPTTAGTLEAAKLGLLIFLILVPSGGSFVKMLLAFAFTFTASMVFLELVRRMKHRNIVFVPLVGLMFGSIIGAVASFVAIQMNVLQDVNAWLVGDFSGILQGRYELVYISLPTTIITYLYANQFTLVGMGEELSRSLGLNYRMVLNVGLVCVSLTVSAVVITAGAIPFLGLIVPNVVSLIFGDNLRRTLPVVALSGALFLVLSDIVGRVVIYPFEVPIGLTVSILGAAIFLVLILRRK